jgi:two-component system, OmpR family, copper resistance phosphate regulon response regulator CusR
MKILLAEDDRKFSKHLSKGLETEGFAVDQAFDGEEARALVEKNEYDVLAVDVNLPLLNGFQLVGKLRESGVNTPVIFVTGSGDVTDVVHGLDVGGDDYIVKPFRFEELVARLRAILRRQRPSEPRRLKVGDLELDVMTRQAHRGGRLIELTNREFAILEHLMSASPNPVAKDLLTKHVWNQNFAAETNVLNVHIKNLRRKLDGDDLPQLLHTVRNVGFALREENGSRVADDDAEEL